MNNARLCQHTSITEDQMALKHTKQAYVWCQRCCCIAIYITKGKDVNMVITKENY